MWCRKRGALKIENSGVENAENVIFCTFSTTWSAVFIVFDVVLIFFSFSVKFRFFYCVEKMKKDRKRKENQNDVASYKNNASSSQKRTKNHIFGVFDSRIFIFWSTRRLRHHIITPDGS